MLCIWNYIRYQEKNILMEKQTVGVFWGQVQFFFPNRRTFEIP